MTYLALLRGVNVGGNAIIKMADLRAALEGPDFQNVATYIQSGNVIFDSNESNKQLLTEQMQRVIHETCDLSVDIVLFTHAEWRAVIAAAPEWWGKDTTWKHNMLVMIGPFERTEIMAAYGELKPEIESIQPGVGVFYQSLSFERFGQTTGGKLASNPIYKKMTIRNYNTSQKLLALLDNRSS